MSIKEKIRTIPNWPIDGVMFRDITTLIQDPAGLRESCDLLFDRYKEMDIDNYDMGENPFEQLLV